MTNRRESLAACGGRMHDTSNIFTSDEDLLVEFLSLPRLLREERFITTSRAADLTGLSIRTIQLWVESGYVRSFTVGKRYRIEQHSLVEYLNAQLEARRRV